MQHGTANDPVDAASGGLTGSHVCGTNAETPSPVTILTAAQTTAVTVHLRRPE